MNSLENASAASDEVVTLRKLPFTRIRLALDQILTIALPIHVQALKEKSENIALLKNRGSHAALHAEQLQAAKYLKLLKADLYELEQLNLQVEDKDQDLFYSKIKTPIKESVEILSKFMELHPDILEPFPNFAEDNTPEFPNLICYLDQESEDKVEEYNSLPVVPEIHEAFLTSYTPSHTHKSTFPDWSFLRKELLEVHSLIRHFSSLVFTQKESVNSIQSNVEQAHGNVQEGVTHLKKASILKAATFPVVGAVVGGLLLGPVGALAGFKLVGTAACIASGGALGYKAGATLKKKREISCDIEMKALTYPSKEKSNSNPELSSGLKES